MDIFDIHNVKSEKNNTILQYRRLKEIAKLFRLVELLSAVVLLSWISTRLPFVIKLSGEYFRHLLSVIVSPLFIFLIGNVIVLTLVVKSGQLTGNSSTGTDLYEEIVNNEVPPVVLTEEIVYQDKQIVFEESEIKITRNCCEENEIKISESVNKVLDDSVSDLDLKVYRRSESEKLKKNECSEKVYGKLRRSEMEVGCRKVEAPVEKTVVNVVDELSNEEFQRRIEGFIARQVRFHQEEKLSVVPHNLM